MLCAFKNLWINTIKTKYIFLLQLKTIQSSEFRFAGDLNLQNFQMSQTVMITVLDYLQFINLQNIEGKRFQWIMGQLIMLLDLGQLKMLLDIKWDWFTVED